MGLEVATFISGLNANNPVNASDNVSEGDDHLRLIKSTLLNTFPNITGAMNASHTELNNLVGVTGKTGTGNLVLSASPTFTGTIVGLAGSGANLTALNAAQLTSGIVPDARIGASSVTQHVGSINHDLLLGFVADEHIAHSGVSITAGNGLTGGGTIAATRTIDVGAGDGISVAANAVAVDATVARTNANEVFDEDIEVAKQFKMSGVISPTSLSGGGTTDNYAPTGHADAGYFRLTSAGAHSLTGLAGGVAGRRIVIMNIGANPITLLNENAGSTAANRFRSPGSGGGGESIGAGRALEIMYDGVSSRWTAINRS